jgi:hypothetical protein
MADRVAPRIYCIPATRAPVVAVFRRGPTSWAHVGRWDLRQGVYEAGAWFRGRIFPRRSDISPDGRYLCYFAHKPTAVWEHGDTYVAVSRLPWLTALHVFPTCGTWTRGYYFSEDADDRGASVALPVPYVLRPVPVSQFATERRRGWVEAPGSPARSASDAWDTHRRALMQKRQPGGTYQLLVERIVRASTGRREAQAIDSMHIEYLLEVSNDFEPLPHLQWADWDTAGRLLAATRTGTLQLIDLAGGRRDILFEEDLSMLEPSPAPPPDWARQW